MDGDAPASQTIYLRAVVATDDLLRAHQPQPAEGAARAVVEQVSDGLILTSSARQSGLATSLSVTAAVGDLVRIYAISGSNNFEDAVLIRNVRCDSAQGQIESFAPVSFERSTVVPGADFADTSSADTTDQDFWFWQGTVAGHGIQDCSLVLALYTRDEAGAPRFSGLYRWDLQLTVSDTSNPEQAEEQTS
ncbi:MAG: AidA/PixA family protein [Pseudolabrys sp.]